MISKKVWTKPTYFLAFGFGSGLMPFAPGTFGTLAALPLYFLMRDLSPLVYALITILAFAVGVVVCDRVSREMGVHDYGGIVWDEIVGLLITMFLSPKGWCWLVLGFLFFRLFDIWKPGPIRWIDKRVRGGLGIMLDDVLAAIPACLLLHFCALLWSLNHA